MFEGFAERTIATTGTQIHVRMGGDGPPVVLLHGYPQTGACWHAVAPRLAAAGFMVVVPDLRGYGRSGKPESDAGHLRYSKREMAADIVEAMAALGHRRFAIAGHDRGGRVAYRLALDHPAAVERIALLDIMPTYETWEAMNWRSAIGAYHWQFLAQPDGLPERLIGADPEYYLRETLRRWANPGFEFDAEAMAEYIRSFSEPAAIQACCEDYRAGASVDYEFDKADRNGWKRITAPLLSLWGDRGRPGAESRFLPTWREWATDVRGGPIACGHFLPEEAPEATAAKLAEFFGGRML